MQVEEAIAGDQMVNNLAKDAKVVGIETEISDEGEQPIGMIRIQIEVNYMSLENDLENAI